MKDNLEYYLCKEFWKEILFYRQIGKIHPYAIYHTNSGEHSGSKMQRIIAGKRAKDMGQIKGVLDYTAYQPDGKPIFLEFKVKGRKTTPEQKEFIEYQEILGNKSYIINATDILQVATAKQEAIEILKQHLVIKS